VLTTALGTALWLWLH